MASVATSSEERGNRVQILLERPVGNCIVTPKLLGKGAFSDVYVGRDAGGSDVAVKLSKNNKKHQEYMRREIRYLEMMSRFPHPNVLGILDAVEEVVEETMLCGYVMPFMGLDLYTLYYRKRHVFDETQLRAIGFGIASAIEHLSSKIGIVHRDIKPENILMSIDRKSVVLCDFNCVATDVQAAAEGGTYIQSRYYRSPENLWRVKSLTSHVPGDLWSLALVMVELVMKVPVFRENNELAMIRAIERVVGAWPTEWKWNSERSLPLTPANYVDWTMPRIPRVRILSRIDTLRCFYIVTESTKYSSKFSDVINTFVKGAIVLVPEKRIPVADVVKLFLL